MTPPPRRKPAVPTPKPSRILAKASLPKAPNALSELLESRVASSPGAVGLITENGSLTFAEIDAAATSLARDLRKRGVKPSDVVAIARDSRTDWIAMLAAQKLNGISVAVGSELEIDAVEATWVIDRGQVTKRPVAKKLVAARAASKEKRVSLEKAGADDGIRCIMMTSGTTGLPKGVEFTGAELMARLTRAPRPWPQTERGLCLFPLAAISGLFAALESLVQGWPHIMFDTLTPEFLRLVRERGVDSLHGSPLQVGQLARIVAQTDVTWPSVTMVTTTGSAGSASYFETVSAAFPNAHLWTLYGSTECGMVSRGVLTCDSIDKDAGQVEPVVRVEVVDATGQRVPANVEGDIRYQTTVMSARYRPLGLPSEPVAPDGWFYPGDRGSLSEAGRLSIAGRVSDVVNVGGSKVNVAAIDRVASRVSGVIDAAAFAVPSFRGTPALVLALVAHPGFDGTELTQALRRHFGGSAPNLVHSVAVIPRNTNGKINRQRLVADFATAFAAELA